MYYFRCTLKNVFCCLYCVLCTDYTLILQMYPQEYTYKWLVREPVLCTMYCILYTTLNVLWRIHINLMGLLACMLYYVLYISSSFRCTLKNIYNWLVLEPVRCTLYCTLPILSDVFWRMCVQLFCLGARHLQLPTTPTNKHISSKYVILIVHCK